MSTLPSQLNIERLVKEGYARYPIGEGLVSAAHKEFKIIREKFSQFPASEREFVRPGEDEPDLGLICKDGRNGTDNKCYFHFAIDLPLLGARGLRGYPMPEISKLFHANNNAAAKIGEMLCRSYPDLFGDAPKDGLTPLAAGLATAELYPEPYTTNVLRGVNYEAKMEGESQQAAKPHIDRSFLTLHMGGIGGTLVRFADEHDSVGKEISAHPGEVLVFFGVKALYVTKGVIKPMWHGSRTKPEKERSALVQFGHVDIGFPVKDAKAAYDAFYAKAT